MKSLRIWLIQIGEPLPIIGNAHKMRTAILADKLVKKGHSVTWFVSAFDHFKKKWIFKKDTQITLKDRYDIIAFKGRGYKNNISLSRFLDHRIIANKFKKQAPQLPKPDIIITSLPSHDLTHQAVLFAKNVNIPILVDIRDEWPDLFLNHIPKGFKLLAKILLFNDYQMSKKSMIMADGLISVMNNLLAWGINYAKREISWKDRVFYLGSTKQNNINDTADRLLDLAANLQDKFVVTFIGTFVQNNNPSILIECAKKLINANIIFILAGDGELIKDLRKASATLPNIIFTGWLNQNEISALLHYSHIGICPTNQIRDAFPNKVFVYLSSALPILVAFEGELKEIIEKYQLGFYYPPNDVDALVYCIKKLYDDSELYKRMTENAKRVFDEMFDADKIYEEYADHVERVAYDYYN
jgi:glycosyltransferase involved in cell wall biosynthesis